MADVYFVLRTLRLLDVHYRCDSVKRRLQLAVIVIVVIVIIMVILVIFVK